MTASTKTWSIWKHSPACACQMFGVKLIALRGISDGAADLSHVGDWTAYLHVIDERLADVVGRLDKALASGAIRL
jgi:adenosylhomocysteine nucleosidase